MTQLDEMEARFEARVAEYRQAFAKLRELAGALDVDGALASPDLTSGPAAAVGSSRRARVRLPEESPEGPHETKPVRRMPGKGRGGRNLTRLVLEAVQALAPHGPVSAAQVFERLGEQDPEHGMRRGTVSSKLCHLAGRGELVRTGTGRGARFTLPGKTEPAESAADSPAPEPVPHDPPRKEAQPRRRSKGGDIYFAVRDLVLQWHGRGLWERHEVVRRLPDGVDDAQVGAALRQLRDEEIIALVTPPGPKTPAEYQTILAP